MINTIHEAFRKDLAIRDFVFQRFLHMKTQGYKKRNNFTEDIFQANESTVTFKTS